MASNGGQSRHPAWYHNLTANPEVTIEIKDKTLQVHGEMVTGEAARTAAWEQVVQTSPSFRNYKKWTTREIPLVMLKAA